MGCGNSSPKAKGGKDVKTSVEPIETSWAKKTDGDAPAALQREKSLRTDDSKNAKNPKDNSKPSARSASNAALDGKGNSGGVQFAKERPASPGVVLVDADDDAEIEIIYEGNTSNNNILRQPTIGANGQEAPTADEVPSWHGQGDPRSSGNGSLAKHPSKSQDSWLWKNPAFPSKPTPQETQLSQRQKEEAAKLAEQRKRFDNQRYQSQSLENTSPKFTGAVPAASDSRNTMEPVAPLILGLNISAVEHNCGGRADLEDCLPGGIGEELQVRNQSQTHDVMKKNKNKHDVCNDEDEMLMQEILESIDV